MKKNLSNPFDEYVKTLDEQDAERLKAFWKEFNAHCLLKEKEKKKLRLDYETALLYYDKNGVPFTRALTLLDTKNLGGFYARPALLWFPLDDAAKIYPLSMEHGRMSVFRLSVYLKTEIAPELLQMALNFTIKRFPSFATTLKKGFFWHYLDTTKRRFYIEKENDVPCQPLKVSMSGSQSFRVLYYQNRISVEFFHVLTDGMGGMMFLKSLLAEYLRLSGIEIDLDESVWDVNETPSAEEFENAFSKVERSETASGFVNKTATQMNGRLSKLKPCRILHFKMDVEQLKKVAKIYDTTVTIYLLSLMFLSGTSAMDNLQGDTSIQVPINMRKFYPSKTARNFSMYCGIRIPIEKIGDRRELIAEIQTQIQEKLSKESMTAMVTATEKLVGMMRYIPLIIKQPVAHTVYGFLGDKTFTNTLSNLGVVRLPKEMAEQVESMDFVLGTAITNRSACSLVTVNNTANFSIAKCTIDPSFEEKMYELLTADGIEVNVEGSDFYES